MQFPLRRSFPQSYLTALLSNSFPYVYLLCGVLSLFIPILFYFIKLRESKRHLCSISLLPRAHKIQSLKFLRTQRSMCDNYWFSNPSVILVSYLEILVQQNTLESQTLDLGFRQLALLANTRTHQNLLLLSFLGMQKTGRPSFLTAAEVKNTTGQLVNRMTRIYLSGKSKDRVCFPPLFLKY